MKQLRKVYGFDLDFLVRDTGLLLGITLNDQRFELSTELSEFEHFLIENGQELSEDYNNVGQFWLKTWVYEFVKSLLQIEKTQVEDNPIEFWLYAKLYRDVYRHSYPIKGEKTQTYLFNHFFGQIQIYISPECIRSSNYTNNNINYMVSMFLDGAPMTKETAFNLIQLHNIRYN